MNPRNIKTQYYSDIYLQILSTLIEYYYFTEQFERFEEESNNQKYHNILAEAIWSSDFLVNQLITKKKSSHRKILTINERSKVIDFAHKEIINTTSSYFDYLRNTSLGFMKMENENGAFKNNYSISEKADKFLDLKKQLKYLIQKDSSISSSVNSYIKRINNNPSKMTELIIFIETIGYSCNTLLGSIVSRIFYGYRCSIGLWIIWKEFNSALFAYLLNDYKINFKSLIKEDMQKQLESINDKKYYISLYTGKKLDLCHTDGILNLFYLDSNAYWHILKDFIMQNYPDKYKSLLAEKIKQYNASYYISEYVLRFKAIEKTSRFENRIRVSSKSFLEEE